MNPWQISQQLKYLLDSLLWSTGSDKVFGEVSIAVRPIRNNVVTSIKPAAFIRVGRVVNDADFPEILVSQQFTIDVVTEVPNDPYGEAVVVGGVRTSLAASQGRGVTECVAQALTVISRNDSETGISILSRATSQANVIEIDSSFFSYQTIEVSAKGGEQPFYHPGRRFINTAGVLTWINAPNRWDFHAATVTPSIPQRGRVVLRYAAGTTPPATITDGSGATLGSDFATTYTHGTDGQGAGTFSYSLFMVYDVRNQLGADDASSAALTLTGSF